MDAPLIPTTDANPAAVGAAAPDDQTDPVQNAALVAQENLRRYRYVVSRGHRNYCLEAKRNENFYLGGGLQWDPEVRAKVEGEGRPASEINEVFGALNAAAGFQIANRMDIACEPRGDGASDETAKALNLIFKAESDRLKYRWLESQVFEDGLIQQRGYFDLRISRNAQMQGELSLCTHDPMDVLPDPDAKSYDPDDWADVTITRWLSGDEIEQNYGKAARAALEAYNGPAEPDFGDGDDDGVPRSRFGDTNTGDFTYDSIIQDTGCKKYRVIDRQHHRYEMASVAIYPTGDVVPVDDVTSNDELRALEAKGAFITQRRTKRVRWTVSCCDVLLSDGWSPYEHFTIIPFFPYFRRGRTRGLIDNAISPQETLNKATAQALHIVNSTANSGWISEDDSLANMEPEDLEDRGSETGLNIVVRKGAQYPQKIKPNDIPTGMVQLIQTARENIKSVTGVNESMLGVGDQDMSGVAIQSRQYAAQQQLAKPLDNLGRTRHMFASRALKMFQAHYSDQRVFSYTETDKLGQRKTSSVVVNEVQPDGQVFRDLTLGKYDIAITDQPLQITFDNSQFEQVRVMRKDMGVKIPDSVVVRYSNLADKTEVLQAMQDSGPPPLDPLTNAKIGTEEAKQDQIAASAEQTRANTALLQAEAVNTGVTGMYSATRAAMEISAMPAVAPIADELLKSAGFVDRDAPPIVPNVPPQAHLPAPPASESTNPLTPPHPDVGVNAGIERPELPQ